MNKNNHSNKNKSNFNHITTLDKLIHLANLYKQSENWYKNPLECVKFLNGNVFDKGEPKGSG